MKISFDGGFVVRDVVVCLNVPVPVKTIHCKGKAQRIIITEKLPTFTGSVAWNNTNQKIYSLHMYINP